MLIGRYVGAVGAVVMAAGTALAGGTDQLRLTQNAFSAGNGGEFTATPVTGNAGLTGLPADLGFDSFQTFCVEENENFRPGDLYFYALNTGAIQGGVSGQEPVGSGFDPLDARTAYLYHHFRFGTLAGYDYSPAGRNASAALLQQAIWYIEGEGGTSNGFVTLAETAIANGQWFGIGDVRVLNLSNGEFPNAQDQLTIVGIPTPGAAAGIVMAGGVLGLRRRRRA